MAGFGGAIKKHIHDIRILASTDPVAIDKASIDLVFEAEGSESFKKNVITALYVWNNTTFTRMATFWNEYGSRGSIYDYWTWNKSNKFRSIKNCIRYLIKWV